MTELFPPAALFPFLNFERYRVYGCGFRSTFSFPELPVWDGQAAVTVCQDRLALPCAIDEEGRDAYCLSASVSEIWLRWRLVGTLLIRGRTEMVLDPTPGMEDRVLRLFILGAGFGVLLYQRSCLALHASAISVDGGGVAFAGARGLGKSTTAAALYARGHAFISDDLAAVDFLEDGTPALHSGVPVMKLCPSAVAAVARDEEDALPVIHSWSTKRARQLSQRIATEPVPLRQVYFLKAGPATEVKRLSPTEALYYLLSHIYVRRLMGDHFVFGAQMQQCAALASRAECYLLQVKRDLSAIQTAAQMVEELCSRPHDSSGSRYPVAGTV